MARSLPRRKTRFRLALACLIVCTLLWCASIVTVIAHECPSWNLLIARGQLEVAWGGDPMWRTYSHRIGHAYSAVRLFDPEWNGHLGFLFPGPEDLRVRWDFHLAQLDALRKSAFWSVYRLGFGRPHISDEWNAGECAVTLPTGWPVLGLATLTASLFWLARRRPPKDHCPHCAYNLTGNQSGVCPECGRPIDASTQNEPKSPAHPGT